MLNDDEIKKETTIQLNVIDEKKELTTQLNNVYVKHKELKKQLFDEHIFYALKNNKHKNSKINMNFL